MSGGRKISDHGSWMGKGSNGSILPVGNKVKMESSAEGSGALAKFEDTTEAIKAQQEACKSKVKSHASKPMYRN